MPYVERTMKTGETVEKDRYFTPERKRETMTEREREQLKKENSKKAAAFLRRLLTADEKDLPEINIEFGYQSEVEKTDCNLL